MVVTEVFQVLRKKKKKGKKAEAQQDEETKGYPKIASAMGKIRRKKSPQGMQKCTDRGERMRVKLCLQKQGM